MQRLTDDSIEVRSLVVLSDESMLLQFRHNTPVPLATENVVLASFTTAHARIHLFGIMDRIAAVDWRNLLYHDTDSALYVQRPGGHDPETGPYLGDLTQEYADKNIRG